MSRGLVQVVWDRDLDRKSEILTILWFYNPREEIKPTCSYFFYQDYGHSGSKVWFKVVTQAYGP